MKHVSLINKMKMEPSDVDPSSGTSYWTVQILLKCERTKEVGGVIQSGSGWKATQQIASGGDVTERHCGRQNMTYP